jgi:5-methylcytosine-specific restriction protein A
MLNRELNGKKFNRAEVIRQFLSFELNNRSRGSVEFRLQNISSVLQELSHPTVQA